MVLKEGSTSADEAQEQHTAGVSLGQQQQQQQQQQQNTSHAAAASVAAGQNESSPACTHTQDTVSGFAFGSLLSYVKEFGTPHQSSRAGNILNYMQRRPGRRKDALDAAASERISISNAHEDIGNMTKGSAARDGHYWQDLRQILYEISGDWLWRQACHNFRTTVAAKMANIPEALREDALGVKKPIDYNDDLILKDKDAEERGYFPFAGYVIPSSDEYFEEGGTSI